MLKRTTPKHAASSNLRRVIERKTPGHIHTEMSDRHQYLSGRSACRSCRKWTAVRKLLLSEQLHVTVEPVRIEHRLKQKSSPHMRKMAHQCRRVLYSCFRVLLALVRGGRQTGEKARGKTRPGEKQVRCPRRTHVATTRSSGWPFSNRPPHRQDLLTTRALMFQKPTTSSPTTFI